MPLNGSYIKKSKLIFVAKKEMSLHDEIVQKINYFKNIYVLQY